MLHSVKHLVPALLTVAGAIPAPGRALPTCRPDPAYACDSRAFANGTEVCYFLPAVAEPAKPQCGCPKVRPHCAKDGWCYPSASSPSRMAYNPFTKDAKCARCDGSFEAPMPKIPTWRASLSNATAWATAARLSARDRTSQTR